MPVGRSSRTPFKHWLLDCHLGRIAGVLARRNPSVPAVARPYALFVDLCAGDGTSTETHQSSPSIISKHAAFLKSQGLNVVSLFFEIAPFTYASLIDNMQADSSSKDRRFICGDAREYRIEVSSDRQAVFVNCDPNHVEDMPLKNRKLIDSFTPATTFVMTLGCNVGGLKRLKRDRRDKWFECVELLTQRMPKWHDAIIVEIDKDSAQWAYIIRLPRKWSEQEANKIHQRGLKMFPSGVNTASFMKQPREFARITKRLFLTRKELVHG